MSKNQRSVGFFIAVFIIVLFALANPVTAQVSVTATAGTVGPTAYTTVKGAFDAINAGTHQGAVTISITASTAEGAAPAVLNSSGAGAAVYTSVLVRPTVDGVTIAGASPTGRGVIELNGADNVAIDGDNPNTVGTNQNLTIQNTAVNTTTFTSVVRIALSTLITSGDNDVIKNCIISGSATGRNVAAASSQAGSEFTTYGILVGGGASTVSNTTAPSAIASVTTTIGAGITAANFTANNNSIDACARGVAVQGAATTVANGLAVTNNTIGNAAAGNTTTVYARAMTLQGFDNASVFGNTVRNIESWFNTQMMGISLGDISASGQNMVVERNNVTNINNHNIGTFGSYGINVSAGNNNTLRNNFVSGVTGDMTGGAAFSTTFGVFGIRVGTGTGHKVYHNSVSMFGLRSGTTATSLLGAAFCIVATGQTGIDVRNNIFVNNMSGGSTAIGYVAVYLPSGGTAAMNLTLNNNDYFNSAAPAANQGVGQAGTTAGTNFFTQANFDPALTTPASNFRSYTSTLSAAGTNDNATKKVDPLFTSTTDLHIAVASPMVDVGASVGVNSDIDGQTRVPPPDIGADEPSGITPAVNDMAATAIIDPPSGSTRSTATVITPQASFTNSGTAAQTNVPVRFTIINSTLSVVYNMTTTIPSINSGQTLNASFPNVTLSSADTYTTNAIAELAGDSNTANDIVSGTVVIINPIAAGTYTVGSGGNYPSLTNTGGIFETINAAGLGGNITINVVSDLTGELGTNALNTISGGFTVAIKPSGAGRTISGTSTGSGLIKLNGADNVTIDGSLSGGTDRNLTITNGNAGATAIWIASASASDGASSNTVKNCIITGNTGTTIIAGILTGSGTTFGGDAETANSNNTIQNNQIFRVQNAAFIRGNGSSLDQNWLVTGNDWGSTVAADKLLFRGMLIGNAQNFTISNNTIAGISSTAVTSSTMSGIQIALVVNGGTISGNKISDVKQNNTAGWGSNGLYFTSSSAAANITVINNFISDVASQGFNGVVDTDNGYGIVVATGGGYKVYHNSVLMNTNQGANAATGITAAMNVLTGLAAGAVDVRDNIFASTQTLGTRYGVLCSSANTVFSSINYNDYFAQNVGFIGGSARATLANWQTGTGQDANSKSVDPLYVTSPAPADLHLQAGSTLLGQGLLISGIDKDIDNDLRDDNPDIGADERVAGRSGTIPAGTYRDANIGAAGGTLGGNVTITGILTLSGILNTGANTLIIDCTGSVSGASPTTYVIGNLQKNFCGTGVKGFEVGTANAYSPVSVTVTAGTFPADFTVKAVQGPQPNIPTPALALSRYWTLTGAAGLTANLNFNYNDIDIPVTATEADFVIQKYDGAFTQPGGTVSPGSNQASITGVTSFSDWTLADTLNLTVTDVTQNELNSGSSVFTFMVNLDAPAPPAGVTFDIATADGSAQDDTPVTEDNDYVLKSETGRTITSGNTSAAFTVTVNGDPTVEPNETFFVNVTNVVGATVADGQGQGTITNDDSGCVAPATAYVGENADFVITTDVAPAGLSAGDTVTWNPGGTQHPAGQVPGLIFGCQAFSTIQTGVDGVATGGTVLVTAGTYAENVLVNKSASLLGPNAAINPNTGVRVGEAIVLPAVTETSIQASTSGTIFRVGTGSGHIDATIKGFTIDGHNSSLTSGRTLNGVEIHTGAGIVNSIGSFDSNPGAYNTTMTVQNNIIQNLERYGVLIDGVPSRAAASGNDVSFNKIDNLPSGNNFGGGRGRGVAFEENIYGSVTYNVITRVNVGWQDDDYDQPSPGAGTVIDHNTIHSYHRGVFHNLQYSAASNIAITNNDFFVETTGDFAASSTNFGLELSSIQSAVGATVTGNNSTGNVYGILLWNLPTTGTITVSGGTLTGNQWGILATNYDPQFGAVSAATSAVISGVAVVNATTAGIKVEDHPDVSATGLVSLNVKDNTAVSGSPTGIRVEGPNASAIILNNALSIHNNTTGISVDAGSATITGNNIFANTTGLQFANGATGTAHFNRIVSTTTAIANPNNLTLDLENNWWGCTSGPGTAGCGAVTGTGADFNPWIVLGVSASPAGIPALGNSTITADMRFNSAAVNMSGSGTIPLTPVAWNATNGSMAPPTGTVTAGLANSTFTSANSSAGTGCATVDNQNTCANVTILPTTVTIVPAPAPSAADNDYTRINNAVQASFSGQTIKLLGTFNWTEANAAASWALGSNGIGGDLDDYSILVPANLNNVTFTADNLGDGTIQGPGDLAALDLEGVFFFDSTSGIVKNQNWTISNIRFLDFDLSIGMFDEVGGAVDAYNNTHITNNYIRIAQDLNATIAPSDSFQNIGIHFAFGTNQLISGNTIDFNGDGNSSGANFSSQVGMQSNTSGGAFYDGLQITNNTLHVLNAQSANPQVILGIWENGSAHASNINVSGNSFTNQGAGNNTATNIQRGFRVTSHSSATSTVTYQNNTVSGANIGFQWLAGSNFSGNLPVVVKSNTITGNGTGVLVQSNGLANLSFNRIVGNTVTGLNNVAGTTATAENNWWGCNAGPGGSGCDTVTGTADFNPWIVLSTSASPAAISPFGNSTITADMRVNSDAVNMSGSGTIPPTPVAWNATNGTMAPPAGTVSLGLANSTFTSTSSTAGTGCATVDNQNTCATVSILQADLSITKTDGVTTATPGGSVTYTITASNAGPNPAPVATVADTFPAILTCSTTSLAAGGASGNTAGPFAGNINDNALNMPASSSVTYTSVCTINASATGTLANTATVSSTTLDPVPGNNSATDTDTLTPQANLAITKTDGVATAVPGGSTTYTITASNAGPSNAPGSNVTDNFPAAITGVNWTCVGAGGGTCTASGSGNINQTVNLPVGSSVTFMAVAAISPAATGSLANTATTATGGGVTDPTPGNNSATDTDTLTPQANLGITKTDGVTTVNPGGSTTYTITASNAGPSNAPGTTVADIFPAILTCTTTSVAAGGATGNAAGPFGGNINNTLNMPVGSSVTYTSVCNISGAASGTLTNTATVTAAVGVTDPTPGNNTATDADIIVVPPTISKNFTSPTIVFGEVTSLNIIVGNPATNVVNLTGVSFTDTLPAGITVPNLGPIALCGGSYSATAPNTVTMTGVTITPGATCTATVAVTGVQIGPWTNTINSVSSTNGGTNNTPASAIITVNKASTTASVISDTPDPSVFGQNYTVGAQVIVTAPGSPTPTAPTGTITVTDGTNNCTITLSAASCLLPSTSVGAKTLTATYNGDGNFNASLASPGVPHTVNKANTATVVTSSANPSAFGQNVGFTATVSAAAPGAGTPTGTVTFAIDGVNQPPATLSGGSVTMNTSTLSVGTHTITAQYNGDANFNTSNGALAGGQVVGKANTTTVITNAAALASTASNSGQPYAVNFTVTPAVPGAGTPTGFVSVTDGTDICLGTVASGTCNLTSTTAGVKTITATYLGDPNFNSSSGTATHTVLASISGNIQQFVPPVANLAPEATTPLAGVTVSITGTAPLPASTTTDANGNYSFGGLTLGGNYTVTPTMAGKSFEPLSRSYTNVTANVTGADFVAYAPAVPREIKALNAYALQGQPAVMQLVLTGLGNEKTESFSLNFNINELSAPTVACGTSDAGCTIATDTSQPGKIGITVTPATQLAAGPRNIANVTFQTFASEPPNSPVTFGGAPTPQSITDAVGNPLQTAYTGAFAVFAKGFEGDVAPRPNGSGETDSSDIVGVSRFVAGLDNPVLLNTNEFQRADASPNGLKGDGKIDSTDIVQTTRYGAGLDGGTHVIVAGPMQALPLPPALTRAERSDEDREIARAKRTMRVGSVTAAPGSDVEVSVELDSRGDEVASSFTLNFDPARLRISGLSSPEANPDVAVGRDAPAGTGLAVNATNAARGQIGIVVFNANLIPFSNATGRKVVTLHFRIAEDAPTGPSPITFGDTDDSPTQRSLSDGNANPLKSSYTDGEVNIIGTNGSGLSLRGRMTDNDKTGGTTAAAAAKRYDLVRPRDATTDKPSAVDPNVQR